MDLALREQPHGLPARLGVGGGQRHHELLFCLVAAPFPEWGSVSSRTECPVPPPHTHTVVPPQMPVIPVTVPASRSRAWRKYRHKPVDPIVLQVSQPGNDGGRAVGMPRRGGRGSVITQVPRDGHKKRSATEEAMSFASHVLTQRRPERSQVGMPSLQRDLTWIQASRSPNGQTNLFFFLVPEKETLGCQREMTCM